MADIRWKVLIIMLGPPVAPITAQDPSGVDSIAEFTAAGAPHIKVRHRIQQHRCIDIAVSAPPVFWLNRICTFYDKVYFCLFNYNT